MIVLQVRCEPVQFVRPMTMEGVPCGYVSKITEYATELQRQQFPAFGSLASRPYGLILLSNPNEGVVGIWRGHRIGSFALRKQRDRGATSTFNTPKITLGFG